MDPFESNLLVNQGNSTLEFKTLQLIVLGVFGVSNWKQVASVVGQFWKYQSKRPLAVSSK